MQRFRTCLACTAILISGGASAYTSPPFPRLAVNWISNQGYANPAIQSQLAHGDVAIILTWPGWGSGTGGIEPALESIKAINPNVLIFEYIKNNETYGSQSSDAAFAAVFNKLNAMNWYLYPSGGSGSTVPSGWPGATSINNTVFTPPDSNGDNFLSWFAKYAVATFYTPSPSFDGMYVDNVFLKPRVNGDWNRDGVTDSANSSQAAQWQQQGYVSFFGKLRSLMPGKFQFGNISDWVEPNAVLTHYQGMLDGGFMEGMIGYSWSIETWGGWHAMMTGYRQGMAALSGPKIGIFAQVGNPTDYQSFRYGFASALMGDAFYTFNALPGSYGDWPWFDEYSYQHKFGAAVSSPSTTAWQHGVYRRDFENGIALINPKGNGTQTVTLEANYTRITGSQAPSINSGQTVRTLTLQDRDGIILLRNQPLPAPPAAVPAPPAEVTVQ
jgi:hypothetical protein